MTVQLQLPKDLEERLLAEVRSGRHVSIESAILEKLAQPDEEELFEGIDMPVDAIRQDLKEAWNHREDKLDGDEVFRRLRERNA